MTKQTARDKVKNCEHTFEAYGTDEEFVRCSKCYVIKLADKAGSNNE